MKLVVKALKRRRVWQFIILLVVDALVFGGSNARNVSSFMLIVGFVLLSLTVYHLLYGLLAASRIYGIRFRRQQRLVLYLSGLLSVLVALQSIGELSPRDVAVLLPLMAIGYLYSSYGLAGKRLT